jgi:hypothetical protein
MDTLANSATPARTSVLRNMPVHAGRGDLKSLRPLTSSTYRILDARLDIIRRLEVISAHMAAKNRGNVLMGCTLVWMLFWTVSSSFHDAQVKSTGVLEISALPQVASTNG